MEDLLLVLFSVAHKALVKYGGEESADEIIVCASSDATKFLASCRIVWYSVKLGYFAARKGPPVICGCENTTIGDDCAICGMTWNTKKFATCVGALCCV